MANAKASPNLEALPASPSLAQTLPSDAVLDALKMILLGAPLYEVLTTITRLIEAHSTGMLCSIFLLDEDGLHLRHGVAVTRNAPEATCAERRSVQGMSLEDSSMTLAGRQFVDEGVVVIAH